jgi:outer membrane protein OmpA-like peptidoglycan-associated protein
MNRYALLMLLFVPPLVASPAHAQTSDEIVKKLEIAPGPTFKGVPFGEPGQKGVKTEGGTDDKPPSIDLNVPFEYNSDKLTGDAYRVLRNLGVALKDSHLANYRFKIAGFTDAKGAAEFNQKLSERRAQSVRDYLVYQYDVEAERLDVAGYGMSQLADPAHPEDAVNRRVQVINLGSGK